MFPLINKPTRITNHSATLIDNIFTNAFGINHNSGILVNDLSDHLPIFTIREENLVISNDVPMVSYIKVKNKSKKNMKIFCEELVMESWQSVYNAVNVNTAYDNFIQIIDNFFNKCCPIIVIKSPRKFSDKPWMTSGLKNSCRKKKLLYIAFLKSKTLKDELKYKKYKNKLTLILKKCKRQYFSDLISRHKNNNAETWKVLKDIICKKQSHINELPDVFIDNNREYKADETTEGFNTFFTNISSNLAKRITLQSGSFYDALPNSNCNSMLLSKTDAKEILSIVKKFSNKSSLDCNDMSMSIIKEIIPFVVNPFTYICNLSFYSGDFPNAMKIVKVLPVHKNGAKNEFNNYRPISLLSHFSKILEKLFDLRMEKFINKHNILHDCQFGFRAGRSPNMALLSLIENVTTSLDDHKHAVVVFMDIKKAFDTIDHNI